MPYISRKSKEQLAAGCPIETAGRLTYLIQQLLRRYWINSPKDYQTIAEILGSLGGAKFDFQQRVIKDYEKKKCLENGDVW